MSKLMNGGMGPLKGGGTEGERRDRGKKRRIETGDYRLEYKVCTRKLIKPPFDQCSPRDEHVLGSDRPR